MRRLHLTICIHRQIGPSQWHGERFRDGRRRRIWILLVHLTLSGARIWIVRKTGTPPTRDRAAGESLGGARGRGGEPVAREEGGAWRLSAQEAAVQEGDWPVSIEK